MKRNHAIIQLSNDGDTDYVHRIINNGIREKYKHVGDKDHLSTSYSSENRTEIKLSDAVTLESIQEMLKGLSTPIIADLKPLVQEGWQKLVDSPDDQTKSGSHRR